MTPGPSIEHLTRRLVDIPADFLAEPRLTGGGDVHVEAVVGDLLEALQGTRPDAALLRARFGELPGSERNRLRLVLMACWLLGDRAFLAQRDRADALYDWLYGDLQKLAEIVDAEAFVLDDVRREELARLAMKTMALLPEGETETQAADRLTAIDTLERVRQTQRAEEERERKRRLAQELRDKAAREAASKPSRE